MSKQPSCAERIGAEYADTMETVRTYAEAGWEEIPDHGPFHEWGLSADYVTPYTFKDQPNGYFRFQMSWGGPSDEFRFYVNENYLPYLIQYWFMDWFDGAHRDIRRGHPDWLVLRELFEQCFPDARYTHEQAMKDWEPEYPEETDDETDDE